MERLSFVKRLVHFRVFSIGELTCILEGSLTYWRAPLHTGGLTCILEGSLAYWRAPLHTGGLTCILEGSLAY